MSTPETAQKTKGRMPRSGVRKKAEAAPVALSSGIRVALVVCGVQGNVLAPFGTGGKLKYDIRLDDGRRVRIPASKFTVLTKKVQ